MLSMSIKHLVLILVIVSSSGLHAVCEYEGGTYHEYVNCENLFKTSFFVTVAVGRFFGRFGGLEGLAPGIIAWWCSKQIPAAKKAHRDCLDSAERILDQARGANVKKRRERRKEKSEKYKAMMDARVL